MKRYEITLTDAAAEKLEALFADRQAFSQSRALGGFITIDEYAAVIAEIAIEDRYTSLTKYPAAHQLPAWLTGEVEGEVLR